MIKKLKKNKGETLIEALVSLLIAVLAMGLVASAAVAATNINEKTREADVKFAEELESAEIYSASKVEKSLSIILEDGSKLKINGNDYTSVEVYGDGNIFASYRQ